MVNLDIHCPLFYEQLPRVLFLNGRYMKVLGKEMNYCWLSSRFNIYMKTFSIVYGSPILLATLDKN